jgi:hypothetical protein
VEEEPVQIVTTNVEPVAGDKRPREDDGFDDKSPIAPQIPRITQTMGQSSEPDVKLNGHSTGIVAPSGQMNNGEDAQMAGQDALYIGDLQWVRLFQSSSFIVHIVLRSFFHITVVFFFAVDY